MGFYGNITNVARTQFQFDKTYTSRYSMDLACGSDGVYPGRYVLVEYGSKDVHLNRLYMNNGVPYAGINSHPYYDGATGEIIQTYVQPPDEALRYKVVTKEYENKENDLIIYDDEIFAVPPGRRIMTNNAEVKYVVFSDFSTAASSEVLLGDYEESQEVLKSYLISKSLITAETPWETWSERTHVHIVNGKVVFGSLNILSFTDYPVSLNSIVWKINPGDSYYTNEYTTYFKPNTNSATIVDNVYKNVTFDVVSGTGGDDYSNNHALDKEYYNTSRGYDSTVWQKVLSGGKEKYVMVAELNSVVPTFSIVNDAPTLIPLSPHFDGNSTNVYYRLHWQPSWAIRTKAASPYLKGQRISQQGVFENAGTHLMSSDEVIYPSDQMTEWTGNFYNTITNTVSEKSYNPYASKWQDRKQSDLPGTYDIPAAVYYNKDGFDVASISYSDFLVDEENPKYDGGIHQSGWQHDLDMVGFFPTGYSGHMYNNHDDSLEGETQVDTQEFVCMLPSIGNTIASVWDLVYGGRKTNTTIANSLQRNLDISWEDGTDLPARRGLRLRGLSNGYNPLEVNTIAGSINSVHDLIGMIITSKYTSESNLLNNIYNLSLDRLYYAQDNMEYYRKQLQYDYQNITQADYQSVKNSAYTPVTDLRDFNDILTSTATDSEGNSTVEYNSVFYQEHNNVSENDVSKCSYIQETSYHPNRLYFNLSGVTEYKELIKYEPNKYFYTTGSGEALILDTDTKASQSKKYFELENYTENGNRANFEKYSQIIKIPTKYDVVEGGSRDWNQIHGIYKPNTYYYKSGDKFILDTNHTPSNSSGIYYTINRSEKIEPDENSYKLVTNYKLQTNVVENNSSDTTKIKYEKNTYYYVVSGSGLTQEQVENNEGTEGQIILATGSYSEVKALAKHYGSNFLFKKTEAYEKDTEVSYKIEPRSIYLYAWESQSIFQAIFEDTASGKLTKLLFLTEENIPTTEWDMVPNESGTLELQLVLKDNNGNIYSKDLLDLYVLGVQPATNTAADPITLISLGDIENSGVKHHISKCVGKFYESNLYHYHPVEDAPLNGSYLLDMTADGLYDNSGKIVTYYKINPANISLVPNTFTSTLAVASYAKGQPYQGYNYYYKSGELFKPVVTAPAVGTALYTVTPATNFYEPNKFYVLDSGENASDGHFTLIRDDELPSDKTVYRKEALYVVEDKNGVYPYGTEWNLDADKIPDGVTLAKRTEKYGIVKVPQLARTKNTMHGLILRINQILEAGNTGIRDIGTVQGALNVLNDIIARIDKMKSGEFVIVDEYGRMHSAGYSTAQAYIATNHGNNATTSYTESEDRWIDLDVNTSYVSPSFTVKHNYTAVADTSTTADLNNTGVGNGNNKGNTNTLELYTPIVDNTGHVVGKNIETVTLPYGFKTITATNSSAVTDAPNTITNENVVADNTQDTLAINTSNKWVKIDTSTADTIKIGHEVHTLTTSAKTDTDLNNPALDSITIQDTLYDEAGHMTGNQIHKYILPYGYKYVKASNSTATTDASSTVTNTITANNTQDTLNFAMSNKWLKWNTANGTSATSDILTLGHSLSGVTKGNYGLSGSLSVTDLDSDNTFEIPYFNVDEAGHITSASTNTVALPEGFANVVVTTGTGTANSTAGTAGTVSADTLTDTLTLAEGNKWINIAADTANDKITFSHYVSSFNESTGTAVNFNSNGNTFTVVSGTSHDEAGHLTGVTNTTYTLPNNFKKVNIGGVSTNTGFETASATSIEAGDPRAEFTIAADNRWITLTSNGSTLGISHAAAGSVDTTKNDGISSAQTPAFGSSFNIPTYGVDHAGHISTVGTKTVTLPSLPALSSMSFVDGELNSLGTNMEIKINDTETLILNNYGFENDPTLASVINTLIEKINELEETIATIHSVG